MIRRAFLLAVLALFFAMVSTFAGCTSDPEPKTKSGLRPAVRQLVSDFLQARIDGAGAERFLSEGAKRQFNARWWKSHLGLHPLYTVPGTSYDSFRIIFIHLLERTSQSPYENSYEVGYRIVGSPRSFRETLFVVGNDESALRIGGGRLGVSGP